MFKNYKKISKNKNNIIHIYYFRDYYKKYKSKSFSKILNDIFINIENEYFMTDYIVKYVILYPYSLKKEIEQIYINGNNKCIFINEYNKSIIKHLLY